MNSIEIAKNLFLEIQAKFPHISMEINEEHEHVEINVDIPKQNGINYPINLNLQNCDELHIVVSNFWCEWFPYTDPEILNKYKNIVIGFISGKYRIVEYYKGKYVYKAELQAPKDGTWSTIARWSRLSWPLSFRRSEVIIQNV